ncbi:SDR family NAD(P)-dependent oxidoreductase [Aquabacterium sp. J223]|uniref:SDR family NAD(P)-dependent oxidoreductase n=1 Tax=Aquabacterium sp. J223 TaxID=2898431 RepID=UPI0021AD6E15|nr:SDR family NAD(P)-dependent oxidoreductase [Aquabacterium sp. J223]UUX94799.1 SDR family NAD(P)-dependent oxidoreductase [Aquabacterium sp. J223]
MSVTRKMHRLAVKATMKLKRVRDFALHRDPIDAVIDEVRRARPEPAFEERVVVITGSSEGIGFVVAQAFLRKGSRVVINGRREAVLQAAAAKLGSPDRVLAVCADVSTARGAQALLDQTLQRFGSADLLINNAAVMGPKDRKAWDIGEDDWSQTLAANLTGPFLCASLFMRWMVGAGVSGRIVNVSSGAANAPVPGLLPYAVTKAALDALTRSLAADAEGTGIAVIGLQLGSTRTEMAKRFFAWHEYELLPPPDTLVPAFWYAASGDARLLNGRVIAAWRYLMARDAEGQIAMPMAVVERFRFVEQPVPDHIPPEARIVLNRAENQFGMPGTVKALLNGAGIDVSRYPDPDYGPLRQQLAARHGLDAGCVSFGNGSAELVERVLRVFTKPGEAVVSNEPSWFMFDRFAYVAGVRNDKVPFVPSAEEGFDHNLDGVLAALRGDTRLIYLISPSNPVGVPIRHQPFLDFLARVPHHIPVIVDEAYVEYADRPDMLDTARVIRDTGRMVLALRTFSKFYGLAGLRVGYALGTPQTIDWLDRGELLFNISSFAAEAARAALDDADHARRTFDNCVRERQRITTFLRDHALDHVPSQSNMMLFEPPTAPDTLFDRLQAQGIVPARGVVLGKYVVWPVGLPAQNDRFMAVVRSCL